MRSIDLNADLGEADNAEWARNEAEMLLYISSANIACGGHAGTRKSMRHMVRGAKEHGVLIGAHPSCPDKANFGRKSMKLGKDILAEELKSSLLEQITTLAEIAAEEESFISYVKPHGALYNDAVNDTQMAELIAEIITAMDSQLIMMGAPNSEMGRAAERYGLSFIPEGFIDRRYTDKGHLQSRSIDGAVIEDQKARLIQAKKLITMQSVTTASGKSLPIKVKTLCLHGDSSGAVETARLVRREIEALGISVKAFAHVH
ncbi:5-oxoprolinase subunit PxpA [Hellea balneolensis]|uniref:5-oxoprolinase subunit PxpA n=1 Tax=Hellea balneolensis TaxID=287478 RepID=UPI00040EE52B|nr:5-oxoprolinase subunit PxpA [Hellea balneolensis]